MLTVKQRVDVVIHSLTASDNSISADWRTQQAPVRHACRTGKSRSFRPELLNKTNLFSDEQNHMGNTPEGFVPNCGSTKWISKRVES